MWLVFPYAGHTRCIGAPSSGSRCYHGLSLVYFHFVYLKVRANLLSLPT